jgi:hypothetical protein
MGQLPFIALLIVQAVSAQSAPEKPMTVLQIQQHMNAHRGDCPAVPETGRVNLEMLDFSRCKIVVVRDAWMDKVRSNGPEAAYMAKADSILAGMQGAINRLRGTDYIPQPTIDAFQQLEREAKGEVGMACLEILERIIREKALARKVDASRLLEKIAAAKAGYGSADFYMKAEAQLPEIRSEMKRIFNQ